MAQMWSLLILLVGLSSVTSQEFRITLTGLVPFGPNIFIGDPDSCLPNGNDVAETVVLEQPILFYGEPRYNITVSSYLLASSVILFIMD